MTNEKPYQVKYSPDSEMILIYVLEDDGGIEPIAYLDTPKIGTPEFDESMKRAKIMAAGPEMLAALMIMTELCRIKYGNLAKPVYEEILKAEAAITKATEE